MEEVAQGSAVLLIKRGVILLQFIQNNSNGWTREVACAGPRGFCQGRHMGLPHPSPLWRAGPRQGAERRSRWLALGACEVVACCWEVETSTESWPVKGWLWTAFWDDGRSAGFGLQRSLII